MSNNDIALSSNDTETLSFDLDNFSDDIEKSLFNMSNLMANISSVLEGEVSDSIIDKFSEFETEFPVIGSNLKSYVKDFKNLVTNFDEQDKDTHTDNVTDAKKGGYLVMVVVNLLLDHGLKVLLNLLLKTH